MSRSRRVALALAAVYVVWGSTYLAMRFGLEGFPPFFLSAARFLTVGVLLLGILAARGTPLPDRRQWLAAAPVGLLLFVVGNGFVSMAQVHIGSGVAAVVVATMPLWMAIMAAATGERPGGREWAGIAIGVAAVTLLSMGDDLRADPVATLFLLGAPIGWSLGSLIARRAPAGPGGLLAVAGAQQLCGGVGALLVGLAHGEHMTAMPGARPLAAVAYMVLIGSLLTFTAYLWLLRNTRPSVATSYAFVNPVLAVFLGVLFAGEPLRWQTLVATPIVVVAVALVVSVAD
ncbi:MAG TPA: drug/metabolite exporter YedA [Kofleriaceae bacterium]|nr:drug/metabolite exporter YedA [Kofleriaceae bacterium]